MLIAWIVLAVSLLVVVYVVALYPLLLAAIVKIRGPRPIVTGDALPSVTLVISAFNEESSIVEKLHNSFALDYPKDLLEIVVISDASFDRTDDLVRSYGDQGVRLCRQDERRGKTAGLNHFLPTLRGEIVVFSDANAMYDPQAIRKLVRNFVDPEIGCVTGEARYLPGNATAASRGERAYWTYEIWLKKLETAVGSMVGGDGAIYAIRRRLWQTLPDDAINDFLNPLQIVAAGWRAVYEPRAFCWEETAGDTRREYRRRVRIVSRSWRAVFQAGPVLNPAKVGFFAIAVWSHKVLRWMTGLFLTSAVLAALTIGWHLTETVRTIVMAGAAALAISLVVWPSSRRPLGMAFYYVVVSLASIVGLVKGSTGRVSGVWTTPRSAAPESGGFLAERTGAIVLSVVGIVTLAGFVQLALGGRTGAQVVFFTASAALVYVYLGYPLLLAAVRPAFRRPILKGDDIPSVCLFVAANDEAGVIEAKLRNALSIDYPASQLSVVVASDGSIDGTNEIVQSFARDGVRLIAFPQRRGKIAAINDGILEVSSDIVVFSDANTFLHPGAVRALVKNFADESVGAVSGDVILRGERAALARSEDLYYRYERWLQQGESDIGSMLGVDGALYAIRRTLFVPPPGDTILDDMAIPMNVIRAGKRVVFEPDAIAFEHGSESATEEFSRKTRVVAGAVQFLMRKDSGIPIANVQLLGALISHKTLRWLSPLFALMALTAAVILASHSPAFFWLTLAGGVFILAGLIGCVPAIRQIGVFGLAHYFWLVQTAAIVGVARGLLGRQAVAWRRFARGTPVGLRGV